MKIAIFGANGPTGRALTRFALDRGHEVRAVTRRPGEFPLTHERLAVIGGDVLDGRTPAAAISGTDAVLSTLGVPYGNRAITLYSAATQAIVDTMRRQGVSRIVCVSSSGTDPAVRFKDTGGGFAFERILKPIITLTMGRTLYADMRRMEALLGGSGLDWTVVRPSGLFDAEAVTAYRTEESHIRGQFTSRVDLADSMLGMLADDGTIGKAIAVATYEGVPTVRALIRKEALKR